MVREKKSGDLVLVNLFEDTKIERIKNNWEFSRHPRMAVTAMVPGLSVEAEGVGNSKGELDTRRISFKPDVFAIEIAAEPQLTANREATDVRNLPPTRAWIRRLRRSPQLNRRALPPMRHMPEANIEYRMFYLSFP